MKISFELKENNVPDLLEFTNLYHSQVFFENLKKILITALIISLGFLVGILMFHSINILIEIFIENNNDGLLMLMGGLFIIYLIIIILIKGIKHNPSYKLSPEINNLLLGKYSIDFKDEEIEIMKNDSKSTLKITSICIEETSNNFFIIEHGVLVRMIPKNEIILNELKQYISKNKIIYSYRNITEDKKNKFYAIRNSYLNIFFITSVIVLLYKISYKCSSNIICESITNYLIFINIILILLIGLLLFLSYNFVKKNYNPK